MKTPLALLGILGLLLLTGCINQPSSQFNTGAGSFDKDFSLGSFSNNSTGSTSELNVIETKHAYQVIYVGNWTYYYANVSLWGSIDNSNFFYLSEIAGNTSNYTAVIDKPIKYVRALVERYNASTNSSVASVSVRYVGTT